MFKAWCPALTLLLTVVLAVEATRKATFVINRSVRKPGLFSSQRVNIILATKDGRQCPTPRCGASTRCWPPSQPSS